MVAAVRLPIRRAPDVKTAARRAGGRLLDGPAPRMPEGGMRGRKGSQRGGRDQLG
jgi:hypothetical protein